MKTIESITYMGYNLAVLVTGDDNDKAAVEYFINGMQVTDWGKIKPDFQAFFTTLADTTCKKLGLTKWSY